MKIFVPTYGRGDASQSTARMLIAAGYTFTYVFSEGDSGLPNFNVPSATIPADGIRAKRQWIIENSDDDKILMIDDDLRFRYRDSQTRAFQKATVEDFRFLIWSVNRGLDKYAHVGISDEFMCNTRHGVLHCGRYNQFVGYNRALFPDPRPTFRIEINEEHDFSLQLQAAGLEPAILTDFTKSQKSYTKGGCSSFRTPEVELREHEKFAALWPDLVSVRESKTKAGSLSGYRVQVNWKKALKR